MVILASHRKIVREHATVPSPADHAIAFEGSIASRNGAFEGRIVVYIDMNIGMIIGKCNQNTI